MNFPRVAEQVNVENRRSAWPWAASAEEPLPGLPDGIAWPKISIVTPSYNQAAYLEETIRSVLLQDYPNLEYFVIDGGSSDGSVEIIRKYEEKLTGWVSEPDHGQAHAINKGFLRSSGEIMAWINSDDYYATHAFYHVALAFLQNPQVRWLAGLGRFALPDGSSIPGFRAPFAPIENWFVGSPIMQQCTFWQREMWQSAGPLQEDYHFGLDYDLWLSFLEVYGPPISLDSILAYSRRHSESKTARYQEGFVKEGKEIRRLHKRLLPTRRQRLTAYFLRHNFYGYEFLKKSLSSTNDYTLDARIHLAVQALGAAPWLPFQRKTYAILKAFLKMNS